MTLLDRYIIRRFLGTFVFLIMIIMVIFIIFDLSENIDRLIEKDAPLDAIIFNYYINFIPYYVSLVFPLFVFLSVIFFTSKMAGQSEIIPILSSGVSFNRLMRPYLITSAGIAVFFYFLIGWVLPPANQMRTKFMDRYIRNDYHNFDRNIHMQLNKTDFAYFESFSYQDSVGYMFSLEKIVNGQLKYKLMANRLMWKKETKSWVAEGYYARHFLGKREWLEKGMTKDTVLPFTPKDFGRALEGEDISALTNTALDEFIERERIRGKSIEHLLMAKYSRIFTPITAIVLTVIGLAVSSRKRRGGIGLNLALGITLSFSYILMDRFASIFAIQSNFPPLLAASLPTLIFAFVAAYLVKLAPK